MCRLFGQDDSLAGRKKRKQERAAQRTKLGIWKCQRCTVYNEKKHQVCSSCRAPKGFVSDGAPAQSTSNEAMMAAIKEQFAAANVASREALAVALAPFSARLSALEVPPHI